MMRSTGNMHAMIAAAERHGNNTPVSLTTKIDLYITELKISKQEGPSLWQDPEKFSDLKQQKIDGLTQLKNIYQQFLNKDKSFVDSLSELNQLEVQYPLLKQGIFSDSEFYFNQVKDKIELAASPKATEVCLIL